MKGIPTNVALGIIVSVLGGSAALGADPSVKCAIAKQKAVGKKVASKLSCYSKAVGKAVAVDPKCLSKANLKFSAAFTKAEASGGCAVVGDVAAQELAADSAVTTIAAAEAATPVRLGFGLPCGTTCNGGMTAFLCAGTVPSPPRPVCVFNLIGVPCQGPLDCEIQVGAGSACVSTMSGCGGGHFCASACP